MELVDALEGVDVDLQRRVEVTACVDVRHARRIGVGSQSGAGQALRLAVVTAAGRCLEAGNVARIQPGVRLARQALASGRGSSG